MSTTQTVTRQRRLDPRRRPKGTVKVVCRKGGLDFGANLAVSAIDLSETGVRLLLAAYLPPKQEVTLHLDGPNHPRPLKRIAKVIWCVPARESGFYVGFQFDKRLRYPDLIKLV